MARGAWRPGIAVTVLARARSFVDHAMAWRRDTSAGTK
jgi:hypothetical protein